MVFPEEKILLGYLEVLRKSLLRARFVALQKKSCEEIVDLMDAVHNIPEMLGKWAECDQDYLLKQLDIYDKKWGSKNNFFLKDILKMSTGK